MDEPVETSELMAFTKTVDSKSLSRAAAELGVPRATIGRRLARLEARLGTRLLRRTTRSLMLTGAGETFYRHARIVLEALRDAEESLTRSGDALRGDLRVSVPTIMPPGFHAMVCDFARRHPDVRVHVHFSNQFVDLRREDCDLALRVSSELEPGLVTRVLARDSRVAVASPKYLAEKGTPRSPEDLRAHRCLMGFSSGVLAQSHWPIAGGKLHVQGAFFSNEATLLREAALQGLGIALVPLFMVCTLLESGALVRVLPGVLEAEVRIVMVFPEREFVPPHVRAFADSVAAWARQELGEMGPEPGRDGASRAAPPDPRPLRRKKPRALKRK
jgi:DNA-binding transcriptional LysR family regulator